MIKNKNKIVFSFNFILWSMAQLFLNIWSNRRILNLFWIKIDQTSTFHSKIFSNLGPISASLESELLRIQFGRPNCLELIKRAYVQTISWNEEINIRRPIYLLARNHKTWSTVFAKHTFYSLYSIIQIN